MNPPRYSVSRRKACTLCAHRKVRCDRASGKCTTCAERGEACRYPSHPRPKKSLHAAGLEREQRQYDSSIASSNLIASHDLRQNGEIIPRANNESHSFVYSPQQKLSDCVGASACLRSVSISQVDHISDPTSVPGVTQAPHDQVFDFADLELACPINADEIQNRWLSSYISGPGQTKKLYSTSVVNFMARMMKSYVVTAVNGQGWPPWVHFSQITSNTNTHLSTCLTLLRQFAILFPGKQVDALTTIRREMSTIHQAIATSDDMAKLAIFQAYLIYTMVLYFWLDDLPKPFLREAMINVQELACVSSRGGLVCSPRQRSTRPKWEAWIVTEAKRRTLYSMYMFDSILLCRDGLDNYLGIELSGLPAPGEKRLWQTQVRYEWDKLYETHLAAWSGGQFRIDELWPISTDVGETTVCERRRRVDQWLQGLDEYGTMLFAVTSFTHGC